ncbi:polysaccharide deacetylase, partial [Streptomyces sp. 12257]|nr:polysaccharide deacetylase [Streptomyces sp. 12257]
MRARALVAGGLAAVLLTGCAQSVDPIERLGKKAAQRVGSYAPAGADGRPYRHWGLAAPL